MKTAVLHQRYYVKRALGMITGRDLMVATYLSCGSRLVVQHKTARNYLKTVTAAPLLISTKDLLEEFGVYL